jgi:translation initiation factor 4E
MSTTNTETMGARHELAANWSVWYDHQEKRFVNMENWSDNLHKVCAFGDVEGFWSACNDIGDVSTLPQSSNLHFFRNGVFPMWEDTANVGGGKWVIELSTGTKSHEMWISTLMFCISEMCIVKRENVDVESEDLALADDEVATDLCSSICGAVFSPRRNCLRISVWTGIKDERVLQVGGLWKKFAEIPEQSKIAFKAHENALKGTRDGTQDLYLL